RHPMSREPAAAVIPAAVALGRALRHAGLAGSVDQDMLLCSALSELDVRERMQVYWAARAVFVRCTDDLPAFEALFERFWTGVELETPPGVVSAGESD